MTLNKPDRTLELVSAAYGAAIEPERFDDLLAAWDLWCEENIDTAATAFEVLAPKFEDAITAAETLKDTAPPSSAIDAAQAPMILLDADDAVIAVNAAASALVAAGDLDTTHLMGSRRHAEVRLSENGVGAFRCSGVQGGRSYLAVEAAVSAAVAAQHPTADRLLMLSLLDWDDAFADELKARFDLSAAELRVARGLLEGRTAQEIAGALNRSVATVRSHIKALLTKSGARRQTEFVQLLTILRQIGDGADHSAPYIAGDAGDFTLEEWEGAEGALSVARYGEGRCVLYFTTSSLPEETHEVRAAFAAAGLQVIAPARPGFRGAARPGEDSSRALLDGWLDRLMDEVGPDTLFVGHREGGILAAKAADAVLAKGAQIGGLALISTGAPTIDISEFDTAPTTIKRSFRAARFASAGLTLGYHTAARVFRSGKYGQDRILEYFFRDSPADARRMDKTYFRDVMLANLNYCFQDPTQIARDVGDWGSDWSAHLYSVARRAPVRFIHGEEHTFKLASQIRDVASESNAITCRIINGSAQLALYEQPQLIATEIADLA